MRHGANPQEDLPELWRRIVFSIAISNTDDHLRNHGFLLTEKGWRLSPAYDINPNPDGMGLSLNITDVDNALDFNLAMEVAPLFHLTVDAANQLLKHIRDTVGHYVQYARRAQISSWELERMRSAFRF